MKASLASCALVVLLTACASNAQPPLGSAIGLGQQAASFDRSARSWTSPDAKRQNLVYISASNNVYFFSYPDGTLVGTLRGFSQPQGLCSDQHGDVFVTNTGAAEIVEFPHGGMNVVTILSDAGYSPVSCAVDPKTGDLAVTNVVTASGNHAGNIAIYPKASGNPVPHTVPGIERPYFCGYDADGNLYVDGEGGTTGGFGFAKLPNGGKHFRTIVLDQTIEFPGAVQWDGKYIAVGDQHLNVIDRFAISGGKGRLMGQTSLSGAQDVIEWSLVRFGDSSKNPENATLIAPDSPLSPTTGPDVAQFYKYPAGGAATKTLTGFVAPPIGSAFSIGPKPQ